MYLIFHTYHLKILLLISAPLRQLLTTWHDDADDDAADDAFALLSVSGSPVWKATVTIRLTEVSESQTNNSASNQSRTLFSPSQACYASLPAHWTVLILAFLVEETRQGSGCGRCNQTTWY